MEVPKKIFGINNGEKGYKTAHLPGRVRVAVRLRPRNAEEMMADTDFADCVELQPELKRLKLRRNNWDSDTYEFDEVLTEFASQKRVYEVVAKPVVESVLDGYNGTVMAYGQTGTGKTFTLGRLGEVDTSDRGIMVRSMEDIFADLSPNTDSVTVSYLQLYMETLQDLLNPVNDNIPIVEDPRSGDVSMPGATLVEITDQHSFLELLRVGEANRIAANTKLNTESSRSHAILMVHIKRSVLESEDIVSSQNGDASHLTKPSKPLVRKSKLVVVDLAGSERVHKSGSEGHMLEEAKSINLSLSSLGKCINALAENNAHVPFRDSKLTRMLRDSFGGTARTSLIVTIGPSPRHRGETSSTILFGQRAMKVENMLKIKEEFDYKSLSRKLEVQLDKLIAENERQQKAFEDEVEKINLEAQCRIAEVERNFADALESRLGFAVRHCSLPASASAVVHRRFRRRRRRFPPSQSFFGEVKGSVRLDERDPSLVVAASSFSRRAITRRFFLTSLGCNFFVADSVKGLNKKLDNLVTRLLRRQPRRTCGWKHLPLTTNDGNDDAVDDKSLRNNAETEKERLKCQMEYMELVKELEQKLVLNQERHDCNSSVAGNGEISIILRLDLMLSREVTEVKILLETERSRRKAAEEEVEHLKNQLGKYTQTQMRKCLENGSSGSTFSAMDSSRPNQFKDTANGQKSSVATLFEQVGLQKILSLLESDDANVRIHAVKVVANLAAEEANQKRIVESGGLTSLLMLLRRYEDETVRRVAAGAIANLAMNGEYQANQELIMAEGGITLLSMTASDAEDPQTLRMVAGAIANLCGNDRILMTLRSQGGIKALLGIVRCGHPDVLSQVARGIANFAKCESRASNQGIKSGRSFLIEDGALPWIVQNANNEAAPIRRHLELALCHLAQHEVNAKDLVSGGALWELVRISRDCSREDIRNLARRTLMKQQGFSIYLLCSHY
ncbi:Kinesin-like protein [Vigna angularis]|uniref:Kinesin-like protein n=1 Tax=Phaseolus angularis TaxID=3914 RepID=A0A8T0KXI8_PHAAN|nr:Kinesin-like protein [Vigna angularis]